MSFRILGPHERDAAVELKQRTFDDVLELRALLEGAGLVDGGEGGTNQTVH